MNSSQATSGFTMRRYRWVAMTYATRPAVWALAAGATFFLVLSLLEGQRPPAWQWAYPQPSPARLAVYSQSSLESVRAAKRQSDVDSLKLSSLWYDSRRTAQLPMSSPPAEYYQILAELPHVRELEYTCFGTPTGFELIGRLVDLEDLTLDGVCELDLTPLKAAVKLRRLTLQTSRPPQNLEALAKLPHFDTIVIRSHMAVDNRLLAEIAELPQLKTLVVDFLVPPIAGDTHPPLDFGLLAKSASIDIFYVGGRPNTGVDINAAARAALPRRVIKPAAIQMRIFGAGMMRFAPFALLAAIVGISLSQQFRYPLSNIAPEFSQIHARFGIALAVAIVTACTLRLWLGGASLVGSLMVSAALVSTVISALSMTSLYSGSTPNPDKRILRLSQLLIALLWGLGVVMAVPSWSDVILNRPTVWVVAGLAGVTVASALTARALLLRLVDWVGDATAMPRSTQRGMFEKSIQFREGWAFAGHDREAQIDSWIERSPAEWTLWQRITRWRAGNPPLRTVRTGVLMIAIMVAVQAGILSMTTTTQPLAIGSALNFAAAMLLMQGVIQIGSLWRARILTLSQELALPVPKRTLQSEWMAAFVLDLLPMTILATASVSLAANLEPPYTIRWAEAAVDFLKILPVAMIVAAGIGGLFVVIARAWLAFTLVMVCAWLLPMGVLFAVIALRGLSAIGPAAMSPKIVFPYLWIVAVAGAILAMVTARRFRTMEIGRRA